MHLFWELSFCLKYLDHAHTGVSQEQGLCASLLTTGFIDGGMSDSQMSSKIVSNKLKALCVAQMSVL